MLWTILNVYLSLGFGWAVVCAFITCRDMASLLKGRKVTVYGANITDANEAAAAVRETVKSFHDLSNVMPHVVVCALFALAIACTCAYACITWPIRVYERFNERTPVIIKGFK